MADNYLAFIQRLATAPDNPELIAQLHQLVENRRDPLTGMPDFRCFTTQLQQFMTRNHAFTLAVVAIDHLEEINLISTWIVGDIAICRFAKGLEESLGAGVGGRVSGGTFMVALPSVDTVALSFWRDRLATRVAAIEIPGLEMLPEGHITVSVGACMRSAKHESAEQMQTEARKCLDYAKRQGGNHLSLISGEATSAAGLAEAQLQLQYRRPGESPWTTGPLLQLSPTGLTVAASGPLLVRETVDLYLRAGGSEILKCQATVVWRQTTPGGSAQPFHIGLRFLDLPHAQEQALHGLLARYHSC